jgi:hypothetical protein
VAVEVDVDVACNARCIFSYFAVLKAIRQNACCRVLGIQRQRRSNHVLCAAAARSRTKLSTRRLLLVIRSAKRKAIAAAATAAATAVVVVVVVAAAKAKAVAVRVLVLVLVLVLVVVSSASASASASVSSTSSAPRHCHESASIRFKPRRKLKVTPVFSSFSLSEQTALFTPGRVCALGAAAR